MAALYRDVATYGAPFTELCLAEYARDPLSLRGCRQHVLHATVEPDRSSGRYRAQLAVLPEPIGALPQGLARHHGASLLPAAAARLAAR